MKKTVLFLAFCLLANLAFAQQIDIVIGKIDTIESKILGEQRKIWVHVPDGSNQNYPVVYVLDGDGHFSSVVGMLQSLSTGGNNNCPKMIVVGITNTDRTRDLTPTHVDADPPFMDSLSSKTSGGGENFIAFIEKELMPHIEAKYPTAPYKMLIGHSFGGLAVMQTFTHHNHLFNSYICIDPSMWWDKEKLLKQTEKVLAEKKFEGKSLYLGIANTLEEGMDIKTVQKDTAAATKHIRSILKLQAAFEKNKQNGLNYRGKYYPDDTHGSVPLITEYDALRFFFDFFPMKFTMQDITDSTGVLATKYKYHFDNLSRKMGYSIKPDEMEINYIGYDFLGRKLYKTAGSLFKLNVDNYPESYNVYDSYSDYFAAIGDKANAIIQLKKALEIEENEGSRKKLEKLEATYEAWRTITGYILTANNEPLIGMTLHIYVPNIGGVTDIDGHYTLRVPLSCKHIDGFSYEGYHVPKIPLPTSDTLNIVVFEGWYVDKLNYEYRVARKQATQITGSIKGNTVNFIRPRVRIEGTETVVYADKDGNYALTVPPQYDVLSFEGDNCPARKVLIGDFKTLHISVLMHSEEEVEQQKKESKRWLKKQNRKN